MGLNKTIAYTSEQNELARLIKAIAHPARIAILQHLLKQNSCVCGDIVDELNISQSTVSQHLKEMKEAGIIIGTIEGRNTCYCINGEVYNQLKRDLNNLLTNYCTPGECC